MPFGLVWFGQIVNGLWVASLLIKSPMPFGLVWFGQLADAVETAAWMAESPMPFGLVWFGQSKYWRRAWSQSD